MNSHLVEFSIAFAIFNIFSFNIFNFLHEKQPTPLIDEIFHIPQGLKYCNGNFSEWDPKITTLPGLYLISYGIIKAAGFITSYAVCDPYNLKLINVACSSLSFCLLYSITTFNNPEERGFKYSRMALWTTFNLSIFPVSYFFNFFYYTDTMSTCFFLLMYRMHISNNFWMAAAMGFCSVLIRQTNIIWVGYLLLDLVKQISRVVQIKRRKTASNDFWNLYWVLKVLWKKQNLWPHVSQFLLDAAGYILVCSMFILFVYLNNGIVVGDRSAHRPVIHICQLFYFSLFSIFFSFPHYLDEIRNFLLTIRNNKIWFFVMLILSILIVYSNTMVHPYILADNRHYIFYIWKRLYEKYSVFRYLLVPLYIFGIYCLHKCLRKNSEVEYWLCCALCLLPQKLLEFRYFLLPFILFRLQIRCKTFWHSVLESVWFVFINAITFYIFATKEFYWSDYNEVQRIIW